MQIQPYLMFAGRCEEALAFYEQALGAQRQMLMRYAESPDPVPERYAPKGSEQKVMHAELQVGETRLMMSDDMSGQARPMAGFSLAVGYADKESVDRVFAALSDGGQVTMPLGQTFWSPWFGMLTDRFGVGWMLSLEGANDNQDAGAGA